MDRDSTLGFEFSSDWNVLKDLREKLLVQLQGDLEKFSEPIVMTSLELVGNAIKYGDSDFNYLLKIDEEYVEIKVSSTLGTGGNYELLEENIKKIQMVEDPFELYTQRLRELMNSPPNGPTRIGLIRIAYEGKFELSFEMKNDQVQICARRRIGKA